MAQRFCEENGGSLVKIDSQEKNDAIAKKVAEIDEWTFFIGATDEKEEGTFVWQDGSPLTYRNWAANEPNNDTICGTENYVQMYRDGTWNDLPGWKNRVGFIGEFDKEPAPTPTVKPQETKAPQESAGPQQTKATEHECFSGDSKTTADKTATDNFRYAGKQDFKSFKWRKCIFRKQL